MGNAGWCHASPASMAGAALKRPTRRAILPARQWRRSSEMSPAQCHERYGWRCSHRYVSIAGRVNGTVWLSVTSRLSTMADIDFDAGAGDVDAAQTIPGLAGRFRTPALSGGLVMSLREGHSVPVSRNFG